jgi:hypothetical protein
LRSRSRLIRGNITMCRTVWLFRFTFSLQLRDRELLYPHFLENLVSPIDFP